MISHCQLAEFPKTSLVSTQPAFCESQFPQTHGLPLLPPIQPLPNDLKRTFPVLVFLSFSYSQTPTGKNFAFVLFFGRLVLSLTRNAIVLFLFLIDVDFGFIPEGGQPRPERPAHRRAADSYSDMDFETALEHARPDKKRKIVYGNSSYLDDPCDSDTDSTANANNNSLSALLGAVESVLSEEHAMDTVRTEMKRVRHSVMRIDAARKSALDEMERWVNAQLDYLQRGIIPAQQPLGSIAGGSRGVPSFSALDTLSSLAGGNANRDAMQIDSAVKAEGSAAAPDADEASARRQEEETTLVAQETMHAAISLKSAVESALAVQSSAVMDLENLRGKFALMLVDFRQKMAQELSSINEALGTIRSRHNQAQMQAQAGAPGAGGALSPDQLASINQEVHALNIRMQTASQNFQAQYHLLSQHLSDQLDLAKQTLMMQMQHHQKQFEDTLHAEERRLQAQLDAVRMQVVSQMYPHEARLTAASTLIDDTIQRS